MLVGQLLYAAQHACCLGDNYCFQKHCRVLATTFSTFNSFNHLYINSNSVSQVNSCSMSAAALGFKMFIGEQGKQNLCHLCVQEMVWWGETPFRDN